MSARDNLCLLTSFHLSLTELIKCNSSVFQPTSLPTDLSPAADILDITPDINVISNISAGPELFVTLGDDAVVNEIIVEDELICNENRGEFLIGLDEWNKVCHIKGDSVIFSKDWTNLFNSKLEGIVICVLSFKYKRINKLNSRKNNNCFFRAKAECKFKNCLKYTFTIKKDTFELKPNNYIVVEYLVSGSLSEEHSDDKIVHSRNLSNTLRLEVATQLTEKSISKYFYNQFELSKNTQFALNSGNFNKIKSASVLRKAKFDLSSLQRYSNDNWSDLINLQQHYQETLVGCHVRGYIQYLGHNSFIIHLYTEEQINFLKSFKKTSIILHLDATGSIVRRIEPSQKKVFYYALTVQHPTYTTSPVPLAEMISSSHTSAEISYFLHKWFLDAKKILCGNFNIGQIEVDFSWALIRSTCNVFLNCNIESYLDTCWNCSGLNSSVKDLNVIVHLCSAHLMHGIGFHINKKFKINKDVRRLFLHVIGFMVRCTELSKINDIFNSLCRVFMSKYLDESVLSNIDKLETYISEDSQISPDISNNLETDITDTNSIIDKDVKTYKEKSPFGRHFVKIARNCQDDIKNTISNTAEKFDSNICYHPDIIEYLLTFYLPILPLWSGIILGPKSISVGNNYSHYSNATVENWMRILRLDILRSKTNLRPGDLIKILYPSIESRISAFNFAFHPRATKVF